MTTLQTLFVVAPLIVGVGLAARAPADVDVAEVRRPRLPAIALAGLTLALLCVGLVSHTMLRHVLQAAPVLLSLALILWRAPHGRAAAMPLFAFWLGLMVAIWLFLLGVARVFGGTFTPVEIALTLIIAAVSGTGLWAVGEGSGGLTRSRRVVTAALFSVMQFGCFWLSMQPLAAWR